MTAKRWSVALVSAAVLAGCGGDDGKGCSVSEDADGNAVLRCPDGSKVVVHAGVDGSDGVDGKDGTNGTDGQDGQDGAAGVQGPAGVGCTTTGSAQDAIVVVCGDGPVGTINDGKDGLDGTSCSVVSDPSSGKRIQCTDGTSVDIVDGRDGASCSVADNGDGTKSLSCTDGTQVTVRDGQNGASCSVADNGDGTFTMGCEDGSSVTWSAPRSACSARFDDALAAGGVSAGAFYAAHDLSFAGGDRLISGQGDGTSTGIVGTSGPAALRLDAGSELITFAIVVHDVAIDLIRADRDATGVSVNALREGAVVAQASVDLTHTASVATVRFEGIALDQLQIVTGDTLGLDYVRYDGLSCPEP